MKTIQHTENLTSQYKLSDYYQTMYPDGRFLFFDIETTGLSADNTTLYLIGVLWYEADTLRICQWFNENGNDELLLLQAFHAFCEDFTHLIHFNGTGFDLPYLRKKALAFHLNNPSWETLIQVDIFRLIRPYKNIFQLPNMKQTSIEDYLSIQREDTFTGKDLIRIYQRYIASPDITQENLLLLHNHDDLLGMPQLSIILNYLLFFEHTDITGLTTSTLQNQLRIDFEYHTMSHLPKRIAITKHFIYLNAQGTHAFLLIPVENTTMKHYFEDYKNYYYLPEEDTAIHKSVATYVDASHRVKATKSTCYVNHTNAFIPCCEPDVFDSFQEDYHSKQYYQTLESFLNAPTNRQIHYIQSFLRQFL